MAKKANSEVAEGFVAYLRQQGLEVFKETHTIGEAVHHDFLYIAPAGKRGDMTSLNDLCDKVEQWVQASGIAKSHAQVEHISSIIWSNAKYRGISPGNSLNAPHREASCP